MTNVTYVIVSHLSGLLIWAVWGQVEIPLTEWVCRDPLEGAGLARRRILAKVQFSPGRCHSVVLRGFLRNDFRVPTDG